MIVDNINNSSFYYGISDKFAKAFEFIKNNDLKSKNCGKYEIDGNDIFAIVQEYQTKSIEDGKWEAHQQYTDIQYIISGEEEMGYSCVTGMKPSCKYDKEKDIVFLSGSGDFFVLKAGYFAVFAPQDAHMPGIAVLDEEPLKKVVIKIKL